ncbi:MAG TPA: hypothetical protein VKI41_05080 [Vicinamibacteria bacterium]|nr:hypothetical protein [Vicinamibacteria bacterium]
MGPGGGSGKTGERAAAPSSTSPRADIIPGRLMPFAYYDRLSARGQAIYRRSDRVSEIRLPHPEALRDLVGGLRMALESGDRKAVEVAAGLLGRGLTEMLEVRPVTVQVLPVRPSSRGGELQGLYTPDDRRPPRIQLWMRTAHHRRVVAFRTFLRTLLHEIGHHLDYEYLKLADSYHTEGFFRRESSLFTQLVPKTPPEGSAV